MISILPSLFFVFFGGLTLSPVPRARGRDGHRHSQRAFRPAYRAGQHHHEEAADTMKIGFDLSHYYIQSVPADRLLMMGTKTAVRSSPVHRNCCPRLPESAYEETMCWELQRSGIPFERQKAFPIGAVFYFLMPEQFLVLNVSRKQKSFFRCV